MFTIKTFTKLEDTYINTLPYNSFDGAYKPDFNQVATVTGRLGSGFHTIPSKSDFKRLFISKWKEQGGIIIAPDLSQLELRVGGARAKEINWKNHFIAGGDIHDKTACDISGLTSDKITKEIRKVAKQINFGIVYGKGAYSLSQDLNITNQEAQDKLDEFFSKVPNLKSYIQSQHEFAEKHGFIITLFGRLIAIPEAQSSNKGIRYHGHRRSVNNDVQSPASDFVYIGFNKSWKDIKKLGLKSYFFGTVHDSDEMDVYPGELIKVCKVIKSAYEDYINSKFADELFGIPIKIDFELGTSYYGFETKNLTFTDNSMSFSTKGLRKDYYQFIETIEKAYLISSNITNEIDLTDKDFTEDKFLKDSKMFEFEATITEK